MSSYRCAQNTEPHTLTECLEHTVAVERPRFTRGTTYTAAHIAEVWRSRARELRRYAGTSRTGAAGERLREQMRLDADVYDSCANDLMQFLHTGTP